MKTEGKVSKVAICPKCDGFILASHTDYLDRQAEKEFTELTNEGFTVKVETIPETKARKFADYAVCKADKCTFLTS